MRNHILTAAAILTFLSQFFAPHGYVFGRDYAGPASVVLSLTGLRKRRQPGYVLAAGACCALLAIVANVAPSLQHQLSVLSWPALILLAFVAFWPYVFGKKQDDAPCV